jgi:DNA repair protein RecO (recombination protein O)
MSVHYQTEGIILKKIDKGEADQLFTVYTKDFGKLKILGKGIRKITSKLRGGIDLFYLSKIEFVQGKSLKTLTDAIWLNKFENLRKDFRKLTLAFKIGNIFDKLVQREEADERIWFFLEDVFNKINKLNLGKPVLDLIYYYFLWNLFSFLGYEVEIFRCLFCQKEEKSKLIFFNFKEGGLLCEKCSKKISTEFTKRASVDLIKILRLILERDWETISRLKGNNLPIKELEIFSKDFYQNFL